MADFWKKLKKPFTALAPMDDVTDVVFREIVAETARPDVFFTEFTSADGLFSPGRETVERKLAFTQNQRPIVAQIWGINPENMKRAAALVNRLGFDGVDINMGCPDKAVMKKGAGASLIGRYEVAEKLIAAAREGAGALAVSVKTRLGPDPLATSNWIAFLLRQPIVALTIHARTAVQLSGGTADWEAVADAVKTRERLQSKAVIVGNGDITSYAQAKEMHKRYGADGVMIGRGIFHNPYVFEKTPGPHTRGAQLLLKHLDLFDKTWGRSKNFGIMKKYFKIYINNFKGANELRQRFMECRSSQEARSLAKSVLSG